MKSPSANELEVDFYRALYPDLAGLDDDALKRHWAQVGTREGRYPNRQAVRDFAAAGDRVPVDFDPLAYLVLNPDLEAVGITDPELALHHFATVGRDEARQYKFEEPVEQRREPRTPTASGPSSDVSRWKSLAWLDELNSATRSGMAQAILQRRIDEREARNFENTPLDGPHGLLGQLLGSDEFTGAEQFLASLDAIDFVKACFQVRDGRLPNPSELDQVVTLIDHSGLSRQRILVEFAKGGVERFSANHKRERDRANRGIESDNDPLKSDLSFLLMGTDRIVSASEWEERLAEVRMASKSLAPVERTRNINAEGRSTSESPRAAVIVSLYRSEAFLESFLLNLAEQTAFDDVEVAVALVTPSERESELLGQFATRHGQVSVYTYQERIGIYDAWNRLIESTSAPYITNMNVDDLRRKDSLAVQIEFLDAHPQVEVAYQDVYYTLDRSLTWDEVVDVGFRTQLPHVTPSVLLSGVNAPHNAPIWRRSLHMELGPFDDSYVTAGDFEFWVRCVDRGKRFLKMRDAHVSYYVNPSGLSTRLDGHGVDEAQRVVQAYEHLLGYGSPPPYIQPATSGSLMLPRAERLTLGAVEGATLLRGGR